MNDDSRPGEPQPIRWGAVVGGAVLGFIASWLLFTIALLTMLATYSEDTSDTGGTVIMVGSLLLVPALSGALMLSRRTRQWGAGALIGVAIGSLTGAGICITSIATGM